MRVLKATGALVVLLAGIAGAPVALLWWGTPLGGSLQRIDGEWVLLTLLTVVGWVAWGLFAASTVAEVINLMSGRRLIHLPALGGIQALAGALVLATLAGPVSVAQPVVPAGQATGPWTPAATADESPSVTAAPGSDPATSAGYLVRPGDDLWSLAEQHLGDGRNWRIIAEANPDLREAPTKALTPGSALVIPASPQVETQPAQHVTVVRGDTLSGLAEEHLGRASAWPQVLDANRKLIRDPDLIQIGWRLILPHRADAATPHPAKDRPTRARPQNPVPAGASLQHDTGSEPAPPTPTVPGPSTSEGSATAQETAPESAESHLSLDPALPLVGGISGAAAALVLTAVAVRRQAQLRARALGRGIPHPDAEVRRYETALARRERPDVIDALERTLRFLGHHFHQENQSVPELDRLTLGDSGLRFAWRDRPPAAPMPFRADGIEWTIDLPSAGELPGFDHPVPYPALVTLGCDSSGNAVLIDLESRDLLAVNSPEPGVRAAILSAMAVEIACSPWAAEVRLTVVGGDRQFLEAVLPDGGCLTDDAGGAARQAIAQATRREAEYSSSAEYRRARVNPDLAEAAAAHLTLFCDELSAEAREQLLDALDGTDRGVSAVLVAAAELRTAWRVGGQPPVGTLSPDGLSLAPQLIETHTREAIANIGAVAASVETVVAPWWSATDGPDNVRQLRAPALTHPRLPDQRAHPQLRVLGPVELTGARGDDPPRARRQCEEYCGWLLENPGSTATQMANDLVVAEGTRRSNMSRLRGWLGADEDGQPYLPEAYSGRITLSPLVTSDWQEVSILLGPGANRVPADTLAEVLGAVRGAPLADAAPGQWHWAEQLRIDMSSAIRDVGVVLARRARAAGDLDQARWAAGRALTAAPEDELLLCERILTERQAGNRADVERLVLRLTQQARTLGVDLSAHAVAVCQEAMEGRLRARA